MSSKQTSLMFRKGYVTVNRAAELVGRHPISIRRWIAAHKVVTVHCGRSVYIHLVSLRKYAGMVVDKNPPVNAPVVPA